MFIFWLIVLAECLKCEGIAIPTMDDFWQGNARFERVLNYSYHFLPSFGVGTQVVSVGKSWFLFNRHPLPLSAGCPIAFAVYVRESTDKGRSWSAPYPVAYPAGDVCVYCDGSPFYDRDAGQWHYLAQQLPRNGGWNLAHFSRKAASPMGPWVPDPNNPVVHGGQLWRQICSGSGKHCAKGTVDEGTPQIVEKYLDWFVITFHGYDYHANKAARGVAVTKDFQKFETYLPGLIPQDAIFSWYDCNQWQVAWADGGCIGSGAASVIRSARSQYMYMAIEAADRTLSCDLTPGEQWWPFGLVRAKSWLASPKWEEMKPAHPIVQGEHVGCTLQYNSFWLDDSTGETYWAYWSLNFTVNCQMWNVFRLVPGQRNQLPMYPPYGLQTC